MSDVFISYKAEDRKRVKPLVDALEGDGFSVWWDEQIGGGAAWRHEIETQLNAARCVIVIWSKRSVGPEGTFVHDEAARSSDRSTFPSRSTKFTSPSASAKPRRCRSPVGTAIARTAAISRSSALSGG